MKTTLAVVAMMSVAATAGAQVVVSGRQMTAADEQKIQLVQDMPKTGRVRLSVETKPVVGAPYSGEAVTEAVQVLADGNRIVRRTTSRVYRDGKGRTRRETVGADGQVTSIVISDPASGKSYVIDPDANTAYSNSVVTVLSSKIASAGGSGGGTVSVFSTGGGANDADKAKLAGVELKAKRAVVAGEAGAAVEGQVSRVTGVAGDPKSATKEDLGQQTIEGVLATGSRTTTVIAAGVIGNELPISVVSEEWYSPDLKVLVMSRHADPRTGETTYRLTGVTRSEPNPSLFELPAGTTIK